MGQLHFAFCWLGEVATPAQKVFPSLRTLPLDSYNAIAVYTERLELPGVPQQAHNAGVEGKGHFLHSRYATRTRKIKLEHCCRRILYKTFCKHGVVSLRS